ncbi:MAG TPA: YdiU family protein [Burkholderiales bacterium]|nr:YdiU family protein [Burkholderiales bacterium]
MAAILNRGQTPNTTLAGLTFDDSFVRELPADPVDTNVPRQVRDASYTRVEPTPVKAPALIAWSEPMAALLGITSLEKTDVEVLGGNRLYPGMKPYAARYGGHQFGSWAGQLGDGRAITLGEAIGLDGARWELQLKGAGRTPYSRTADGRAVLRSSLREFLCSEAMHWLGVSTTRALSLVATNETVIRDMFYDGNPQPEPGAVVCRVSPSFLRFGNFQIHAAHNEIETLRKLERYVAKHFYDGVPTEDWFKELCRRTGLLMADWMRLGFVHGVMNTDNMSILGLTIDYGPYGWLEGFDVEWTPNTTDAHTRRYAYGQQPAIAQWNLTRLAEALLPLVEKDKLEQGLDLYLQTFQAAWREALRQKLGLETIDNELLSGMFSVLSEKETDFTIFFRSLAHFDVKDAFYGEAPSGLAAWMERYRKQVEHENLADRVKRMNAVNPKYIFRNYLAVLAIEGVEKGDASLLARLMKVLEHPFDEQPGNEDLAVRRPEWARERAGCSALSCSS